jgi:protein-tyrosine phosphatase
MEDHFQQITEIPLGLPGKVYRSPMPFSKFDQFGKIWTLYEEQNIGIVVVLTEPEEYLVHTGVDLPSIYKTHGLKVIHYPIEDLNVPNEKAGLEKVIQKVIRKSEDGLNIAIHCLAGYGRTGVFLACLAKCYFDMTGEESIKWIRQYIPSALENFRQEKFVLDF